MELRLENMILNECNKALQEDKFRQNERRAHNQRYANELEQQLKKRKLETFNEAKRIEEEAMALSKAKFTLLNDRLVERRAKQEKIDQIRNGFKQSIEMANNFKNMVFEQQRIAEMKAQEYLRMKKDRESRLEHEKRMKQERKQLDADRLRSLQMKFLQMKNDQDGKLQRRVQEQKEREFREKERSAAVERKKNAERLNRARQIQIAEVQRIRQIQDTAEKEEHVHSIMKLQMAEKKELESKRKMEELKEKYRNGKNMPRTNAPYCRRRAKEEYVYVRSRLSRLTFQNIVFRCHCRQLANICGFENV